VEMTYCAATPFAPADEYGQAVPIDGFGSGEMNTNSTMMAAFLIDGEGGLVTVLVKVPHAKSAGGGLP
jgi:hypothetical protein